MKNAIVTTCWCLTLISCQIMAENSNYMVFDEAHTNGTGWVFHNIKFYSNKVNNAYIWSPEGYIESPLFTNPVIRVSITFKAATANTRRLMEVMPHDAAGNEIVELAHEFEPSPEESVAVSSWDAEAGVCRFRIGGNTDSGNIQLFNCLVELEGGITLVFAPTGLENRRICGNSFVAGWEDGVGADSYLVDLFRVDSRESSWQAEVMSEDFAAAVNSGGSVRAIANVPAMFPQLDGRNIYIPVHTNGLVQIGTQAAAGYIALSGCCVEEGYAVRFRASRYVHEYEGCVMPLLWTDGAETNAFASVTLADEMADYEVPLSSVPAGSVVLLHSTTNSSIVSKVRGRVLLDSVSVVSGYTPRQASTNVVAESVQAIGPSHKFTSLARGATYLWRVRSVCGGVVSQPSPLMAVVTEGEMERSGTAIIVR